MFHTALTQRLAILATNLYPIVAPLDYRAPAVIYNVVNTMPLNDVDDASSAMITLKIDVYDPVYQTSKALAKAIRLNLTSWIDPDVLGVVWTDETDMVDDTTPKRLYRTMMTFHVLASV